MSIKHWLPLVALLLLPTPALANHEPRYGRGDIDPYPHSDERFQIDNGPGLDTGCSSGSLTFTVPIDRYVGEVKTDGTLKNPEVLTQQGVISRNVELIMPAYDIDFAEGEVDEVYFNGHKLDKPLQGADGEWHENQFLVPIEWVKFPLSRGVRRDASKPTAAENEITIDIDTNDQGWCTAIDWAQVHFKAMAPLLLIHGIGANPHEAWEILPGVTEYLTSLGIPFEHIIHIVPNNKILQWQDRQNTEHEGNADLLEREFRAIATSFGVQKVHLVGHSKGGLDSRGYLASNYNPEEVRVLSLQTLTSPHHGSVLSDISVGARGRREDGEATVAVEGDRDMATYLRDDYWLEFAGKGPQFPGLEDLQTASMRDFNEDIGMPPSNIKFYTYSADADLNGDENINDAEADPFLPTILGSGNIPFVYNRAESGTAAYHLLRDVSTVRLRRVTRDRNSIPLLLPPRLEIENDVIRFPMIPRQLNDLAVTEASSKLGNEGHFGPFNRNHRNIKDPATMDRVLERIRTDFPVN